MASVLYMQHLVAYFATNKAWKYIDLEYGAQINLMKFCLTLLASSENWNFWGMCY